MHDEGAPREGDPAGMPDTFYMWFGHFDWDEVESIMAGFRATDFNGNGQQDEIPFGSLGAGEGSEAQDIVFFMGLGMVFDAFGVNSVENYYDPEQDLTVREDTYSQSREALKVLQRWFQLGYLDQNLPAVSRAEWEQRWQNGLTGMWSRGQSCGTSSRYGSPGGHCGTVVKNVPEAKLVTTLPMIGPTGITRCPFDGRATPMNPGMGYSIKHDVTDEELARILQIFDYLNYDSQGIIHGQWGPPGLFYEWQGKDGAAGTPYDCINSWATPKEGVSGYGQHYGFFYYNAYHWHDGFRFCVTNKDRDDLTEGLTWDAFMKKNPYIQEISTPDHRGRHLHPDRLPAALGGVRRRAEHAQAGDVVALHHDGRRHRRRLAALRRRVDEHRRARGARRAQQGAAGLGHPGGRRTPGRHAPAVLRRS